MHILTTPPSAVRARSAPPLAAWQRELREAIRTPRGLCEALGLSPAMAEQAAAGADEFSVLVPPSYLRRIERSNPRDPLLVQVWPAAAETDRVLGFLDDPVDDAAAELRPGLLQKYAGRVLMITTGACAIHCRYCFRRHFPYDETPASDAAWEAAVERIAADDSIHEVILSGGDPLTVGDERLARLVEQLAAVGHVRRLRIHTRLPVVIPSRVTDELIDWFTATRLAPVMVIHANHAQELDDEVAESLRRLLRAGVVLVNQAVLLAGVNDSVEAQVSLSERLIEIGVTPYYLHQLDRVRGAAHFEVSAERGREIVDGVRARLAGYLVPRYVQEIPGASSKTPL